MQATVVVLISGEALAGGSASSIIDQRQNAQILADGLAPILNSDTRLAILHGNKPQVGYVLFRSEVASHILHSIPLDVCGADTQGATGYMLSQAVRNVLIKSQNPRQVMSVVTQTVVESGNLDEGLLIAIGPWFDRDKARQYQLARGWNLVEEPGRGYRRGVPTRHPVEILEMESIRKLVEAGDIIIGAGGGGIPVMRNAQGTLEGIECVIESERVACMVSRQLKANILVLVIDREEKFLRSGVISTGLDYLSVEELDQIVKADSIRSKTVQRTLRAAAEFLHDGGEQVFISTLNNLSDYLIGKRGLRIGARQPSVDLFKI